MRLLRFFDSDGTVHTGVRQDGAVLDLGVRNPLSITAGDVDRATRRLDYEGLRLDAPIREVPKLLALAGNYRKHILEGGMRAPEQGIITPQFFWKPNTAINAPGGSIAIRENNVFLDWEVEIAVVMGRRARNVTPEHAMAHVFGYTVVNDISERKLNSRIEGRARRDFDPFFDWLLGKWFDGSAPMGPEIVTADEIADPHDLGLRLWLNGELMQDSNTRFMIFRIPETIAAISAVLTLEPGDVLSMGTPEGVGLKRGRSLQPGDRMVAEADGLGRLETVVVEEAQA